LREKAYLLFSSTVTDFGINPNNSNVIYSQLKRDFSDHQMGDIHDRMETPGVFMKAMTKSLS